MGRIGTGFKLVLVAVGLLATLAEPGVAEERPNVLLLSIDDLNDWVGVLDGHPQARTPHIDRLAREGTLFANAHCPAPVCTPSRAALVTGLSPSTTGLYFLRPHLPASDRAKRAPTLAERFEKAGYATLGVGKIYGGGDGRYFERYGGKKGGFGPRPDEKLSYPKGHPLWDWGAFPDRDAKMPDKKIADWAIDRLREDHDRPFFLAAGFFRPHVPMYVPEKWFRKHPPADRVKRPKVLEDNRHDLSRYAKLLTRPHPAPPHDWFVEHDAWRDAVRSYLASSTFVDHQIGRVLDALEATGQWKNTVVVLFSDHGWHLGEKQRWAKRSLWETSTQVPLVVTAPGFPKGQRTDKPVGLLDIFPTLLDLCGLPPNDAHEGRSLVPLLNNPDATWNRPVVTTYGPGNHAVRSERWRYIRYKDGSEELYDHSDDPAEWHNLADKEQYADVVKRLRERIPEQTHPVLGGKSTGNDSYGHQSYRAAEAVRKKQAEPSGDH